MILHGEKKCARAEMKRFVTQRVRNENDKKKCLSSYLECVV